jgi:hypothetical protein
VLGYIWKFPTGKLLHLHHLVLSIDIHIPFISCIVLSSFKFVMLEHCTPWERVKLWKLEAVTKVTRKEAYHFWLLRAPDLQSRFAGLHYAIPLAWDFNANGKQLNFSKLHGASSQWKSVPLLTWWNCYMGKVWLARPVTKHLVSRRSANFWRVLLWISCPKRNYSPTICAPAESWKWWRNELDVTLQSKWGQMVETKSYQTLGRLLPNTQKSLWKSFYCLYD